MITTARGATVLSRKVFTFWDYLLFTLLTAVSYTALLFFMARWFSYGDWRAQPLAFWGITLILSSRLITNQLRWWLLPFMRRPVKMVPHPDWRVGVATTFVPGAEAIDMLEETVRALIRMDYPHDTWVLDEGDDAQVKALCTRLGAYHFSRKTVPAYQTEAGTFQARTKHGNYNAWLHAIGFARYEMIATFDPDHVPERTFLSEVLGYFNDPELGYVQAAQVYYNQQASFIARGAAEETYGYFSSFQMSAYAMGYPIVTGGHTTHRVTALQDVGGLAPHDADDLLITLLYRARGWRGVYVPQVLARGLTPVGWRSYLQQQLRWARSVLDIKLRIYPKIAGKLSLKERLTSFLHGWYYLQGLVRVTNLVLTVYMLRTGSIPKAIDALISVDFSLLCVSLMLGDFYRQRFYLDWRQEWGWHWRAGVLQLAKWPYFLLALYHVLCNRRVPYVLTSKVKVGAQQAGARLSMLFWPQLLVAVVLGTAWVSGIMSGRPIHPLLHVSVVVTVIENLLLVATQRMRFPAPYDPTLCPTAAHASALAARPGP